MLFYDRSCNYASGTYRKSRVERFSTDEAQLSTTKSDGMWKNQSHGLGTRCAQPSRVGAEARASIYPLATCMPSLGPSCHQPSPRGNTRCGIWRWRRRCCGIPPVGGASRACIVAGQSRSCGQCWNIRAVAWPMTCIKRCWIRWLSCFRAGVASS
jgi:hypothetical protein